MSKCFQKDFYFSQLGICVLKIFLSKRVLDSMISEEISQTTLPTPKFNVIKGNNKFNGPSW